MGNVPRTHQFSQNPTKLSEFVELSELIIFPGEQKTGKKTSNFFRHDYASGLACFSNPTSTGLVGNLLESYDPVLTRKGTGVVRSVMHRLFSKKD